MRHQSHQSHQVSFGTRKRHVASVLCKESLQLSPAQSRRSLATNLAGHAREHRATHACNGSASNQHARFGGVSTRHCHGGDTHPGDAPHSQNGVSLIHAENVKVVDCLLCMEIVSESPQIFLSQRQGTRTRRNVLVPGHR